MKDPVTFMEDIQSSFRKNKIVTICMTVACAIISLSSCYMAFRFVSESNGHIYVVDDGYVLAANRQDNTAQKDLEIISHVTRFHELMYNLAPDTKTIKTNVDRATALGLQPAMEIDRTRTEKQFYTQMIQITGVEEIHVDSVKVDISGYPYRARTWATLYFIRASNVAKYNFQSYSELINSHRSPENPHGLSIEKFIVERQEMIETSERK